MEDFILRSIDNMTQEEMERQCQVVSECPEIPEWMEDEILRDRK